MTTSNPTHYEAVGTATAPENVEPVSRPTIAGYLVDHLIGEGGFGQVWAAHSAERVRVAIKVLHLELVSSNDALVRFERELAAIAQLDHRNVVRALDHGTLGDGRPFLTLEFVEGPSLRDVIAERGSLTPNETLAILEPLCDALAAAHRRGLIHRDVKASNVILGRDDLGARPVLLDFGLVKLLSETGPALTSSRSMLGTPAAMAPEQMRGLPVDARTDVYALGLLTFQMLTGSPAYGAAPGVVQSYLQLHGPRPRPSTKVDIDPAVDAPIVQALAVDPQQRPAGPREYVDALRAVIHPAPPDETDVVSLYIEGTAAEVALGRDIAISAGMTVALAAPDSVLAVAVDVDVALLRARLSDLRGPRMALGRSRATIRGGIVDGPVLDVEGWANLPLRIGLWVNEGQ